MIRASNYSRKALLEAIGKSVQALQDATDEIDEAVARLLEVNRTDLRCLSVLARVGAASPSELADALGLTRAAMTTALDRLEAAGYARRVAAAEDRRGLRVELTEEALLRASQYYGPLARAGERLLGGFSDGELAAILRYLEEGRKLQRDQAERLRGLRAAKKPTSARSARTQRRS